IGGRVPVDPNLAGGTRTPQAARLLGRPAGAAEWQELARHEHIERRDWFWRLRADLDAAALPEGPYELAWEAAYANGQARRSEPILVRVAHPAADEVLGGEAEDLAQVALPE